MTKSKKTFFKSLFCAIATLGLLPTVCGMNAKKAEVHGADSVPKLNFEVNTTYGESLYANLDNTDMGMSYTDLYFGFSYLFFTDDGSDATGTLTTGSYYVEILETVNTYDYSLASAVITVNGSTGGISDLVQTAGSVSLIYSFTVEAPVAISTLLPSNFPDGNYRGYWTDATGNASVCVAISSYLEFIASPSSIDVSLFSLAVKKGDNYVHTNPGEYKITFVMDNGTLSSIQFEDLKGTYTNYVGTYSISIGALIPGNFPSEKTNAWTTDDGKSLYVNSSACFVLDNGETSINSVSIKKHPTLSGSNYVYTEDTRTYTIAMADGFATSITYNDTQVDTYNGTYVSNTVIVTVAAGEHGAVSYADSYNAQRSSAYTIDGATLTFGGDSFTATPEEGYVFDKWVIDGQKVTGGTFSKNVTITATFKKENSGAKFFLKIFYIYGFTLSVKDDQSILDWVFALENLGNGKVIFDFTINDIIDGIGDLIDDVKDLIVDVQEFAEKLSYEIDDLFVSFLEDASPYASVAAFALGGVYFGGLLMSTVASFIF